VYGSRSACGCRPNRSPPSPRVRRDDTHSSRLPLRPDLPGGAESLDPDTFVSYTRTQNKIRGSIREAR
jgi:hypothetical protein